MEKKRKLPARAAARAEQMAKKRTITPPQRSVTPATAPEPEPEPVVEKPPPPPLPKAITAGKPLPTVETPQPEDLPSSEYQSIQESGVLAESLVRSRLAWITDGIFERYWTKPTKRKGVVIEDAKNPPKDSMTKLGHVTITVEPHIFEATMYGVKDPKPPPPPPPPATFRPIIQYGPPNGVMPPPPPPPPPPAAPAAPQTPKPASSTNTPTAAAPPSQSQTQPQTNVPNQIPAQSQPPTPTQMQAPPQGQTPVPNHMQAPTQSAVLSQVASQTQFQQSHPPPPQATPSTIPAAPRTAAPPRGMESVLSASAIRPQPAQRPPMATPVVHNQPPRQPPPLQAPGPAPGLPVAVNMKPPGAAPMVAPGVQPGGPSGVPPGAQMANPQARPPVNGAPAPAVSGRPAPGTDPIILTLAERAGEDPHLRDLMKKVAQGEASKIELEQFQRIIDAITVESKRKGQPVGPSADRLLVDGRTVRYFADEVRAILDIVWNSNPKQTSTDLRPPAGSDPLVVLLVKAALDDVKTQELVRRIAENRPQFSDATDLKAILDELRSKIGKETHVQSPVVSTPTNGVIANGSAAASSPTVATPTAATPQHHQQATRSRGPPPPVKPDISAVVFEFAGGTGDRFLFPKFSILEYVPVPSGQQVIASFLIVRKGSKSEYPVADPELDYYQPVTIRLYAPVGRHLDNLARVVAPVDEVRRYMEDVMDKMTRAEYILLAMRLPRGDGREDTTMSDDKSKDAKTEQQTNGAAAKQNLKESTPAPAQPGVLWTSATKLPKPEIRELPPRSRIYSSKMITDSSEEQQYQKFISTVGRKEVDED
ncbi:hypothetical protein QBC46DRAFT_344804 [Diplogelasinospora grovesii]|uniref:SWR1-complex protein 3 domain-containing protein n=1 Tax=Diplogelasinospora grovesii TaxID=303347 RepID=A0AAN6N123_9PEZI|nr:hypothetical protein QBC46DRAFT_344804 [Diplogelasinospora grovesii]